MVEVRLASSEKSESQSEGKVLEIGNQASNLFFMPLGPHFYTSACFYSVLSSVEMGSYTWKRLYESTFNCSKNRPATSE